MASDFIGCRLGPYEILALTRADAVMEVFSAFDSEQQREVVVRVLRQHLPDDPDFDAGFRREMHAAAALRHPGILPVVDFGQVEGGYYLVTADPGGSTLADLLAEVRAGRRRLDPDDITFIVRQVAAALEHAHSRGMVHGSLSPQVVLITRSGQALVSGFGLYLIDSFYGAAPVRRLEYSAPETLDDPSAVSPAADIYSLGVMLYEMLAGQLPAAPEPQIEVALQELESAVPDPRQHNPDIPEPVAEVVLKALAQEPRERFRTALKLATALERAYHPAEALSGEVSTAGRAAARRLSSAERIAGGAASRQERRGRRSPPPRPPRRGTVLLRVLMVAAVIALLAGAALVLMRTLGVGPGAGQAQPGEQTAAPTLPPTPTATATTLPTLTPLPSATPLQAALATPVPPMVFAPLEAGSSAYRFVDGAVLQFVPAGTFVMGAAGRYAQLDEQPQHTVMLSDFWIDRTEVTNAQYALCVADGLCAPPSNRRFFDDPVFADYPVIYVPHSSAVTYCLWTARATGTATGLPTEAQWEKAAAWDPAAERARIYPWGDDLPADNLARFQGNTTAGIAPAGSLPAGASPYGVLDMAGNVWEWVADWYGETTYTRSGVPIDPTGPQSGTQRVMRGGGWYDDFTGVRSAARGVGRPELTSIDLGFRCAMNARRPDSASGVVLAPLDLARALVAYLPQARADAANNPAALDEWDAALNALELALQSGDNAAALALVTQRLERLDTQEESGLLMASVVYRLQSALGWLQQQLGAEEQ